MSAKLNIEPDFENLLPALTTEEYEQLKENLKADEAAFPKIHVWANHKNTILDGHNQYKARNELRLPVKVVKHKFESRDEALSFAIKCQLGRRNLSESQRAMVAAKLGKLAVGRPKENGPIEPISRPARANATTTSVASVKRADKVAELGSANLVAAVESGDVKVSDAAAIVDLPKAKQNELLKKVDAGKAKTLKEAAGIAPKKISGGITFDPKEIEAAADQPAKKAKSGKPVVTAALRKKTAAQLRALIRLLDDMGIYEQHVRCLNQLTEAIGK